MCLAERGSKWGTERIHLTHTASSSPRYGHFRGIYKIRTKINNVTVWSKMNDDFCQNPTNDETYGYRNISKINILWRTIFFTSDRNIIKPRLLFITSIKMLLAMKRIKGYLAHDWKMIGHALVITSCPWIVCYLHRMGKSHMVFPAHHRWHTVNVQLLGYLLQTINYKSYILC